MTGSEGQAEDGVLAGQAGVAVAGVEQEDVQIGLVVLQGGR
jgi:hypothetical protein